MMFDFHILFLKIQEIYSYETLRMFLAIVFSIVSFSAMVINNLTTRKLVHLIVLTIVGTVLFVYGLSLLDEYVQQVEFNYYPAALITLFGITTCLSYSAARVLIAATTHPRRRIALIIASSLAFFSHRFVSASITLLAESKKYEGYANGERYRRAERLMTRVEQVKEKIG